MFALAMGVALMAAPALAQHHMPMAPSAPASNDPCVLGTNAQPGACVGPVRVAPLVMSQGSVVTTSQNTFAPAAPVTASAPVYSQGQTGFQNVGYAQPTYQAPSLPPTVPNAGCVPTMMNGAVNCGGNWVPAPMPQFAPAPQYVPEPQFAPAPQFVPPAAQYIPVAVPGYTASAQPIGLIPTSFFTGGVTYGAGFPEGASYYGGGGGFVISSGGGTRFSGVRERSPTALIPPPPRQRHNPPPAHRPPCCKH
jgi:hypothetical protein